MYLLQNKRNVSLNGVELYAEKPSHELLLKSEYCELYKELTEQKQRIEFYSKNGLQYMYNQVRDKMYPKSKLYSRAGSKIRDIFREFPILQNFNTFLDVCGAPGAWSDYLLSFGGKGVCISKNSSDINFMFYEKLQNNNNIKCIYCDIVNEEYVSKEKYDIVLADGAPSEESYTDENLQECYAAELILAEVLYIRNLREGGNFVFKIFDTFTPFMKSLLYCVTTMFSTVHIIKPDSSRMINSEKYVVCLKLRKDIDNILAILENVKVNWKTIPKTIVPQYIIQVDSKFTLCFSKYIKHYVELQKQHLKKLSDTLDTMISNDNEEEDDTQKCGKGKGNYIRKGKGKGKYYRCTPY
tara:strand:+ start:242 stop:1303 length:1062 start_codon:yes stop_codon:yes gene_type:complete